MAVLTPEMRQTLPDPVEGEVFSPEQAFRLFDETAKRYFNISGEEFLAQWDAGAFSDPSIRSRAMRVAMLIPMLRSTSAREKSC
jgi:hypothetical protein